MFVKTKSGERKHVGIAFPKDLYDDAMKVVNQTKNWFTIQDYIRELVFLDVKRRGVA